MFSVMIKIVVNMRFKNMTQSTPKSPRRRGRIFPELTLSPEELAKHEAERNEF